MKDSTTAESLALLLSRLSAGNGGRALQFFLRAARKLPNPPLTINAHLSLKKLEKIENKILNPVSAASYRILCYGNDVLVAYVRSTYVTL